MAHLSHASAYHQLAQRLNRFPQGAPPSKALYRILKLLFSEEEAHLVALLPIRVFTVEKAARAWKLSLAATRRRLEALCCRALLVDIHLGGDVRYCLPPPMAGFLEFSMMRVRGDIDQKALAELIHRYVNVEEDFAKALFAQGQTPLGRAFVDEDHVPCAPRLAVLDHERASAVIRNATHIGLSLCYCRHKMSHLGRACSSPRDICLTLNLAAAALIRHRHARPIETTQALEVLQRSRELHLVQFGENVRQDVSFICNCCKCCCEAMIAARKFATAQSVQTTNFLPEVAEDICTGCGQCLCHCPVEALRLTTATAAGSGRTRKTARLDAEVCLGCGVCARVCPVGAVALAPRPRRVITPLNMAHRIVLMAIERGTLPHILLDNRVMDSYRSLAAFLGVVFKLPPLKQLLASRQLQSRYLEVMIGKLGWQPPNPPPSAR